jgi:hypothetical protein
MIRKFAGWNRRISYRIRDRFPEYFHYGSWVEDLTKQIARDIEVRQPARVLECGGVDRPMLKIGQGYLFDGMDIESCEDCLNIYDNFIVQSVEEPVVGEAYDMVISTTLLEHVQDNRASISSIFGALRSGGTTHHYLPSKWHPYSILLRIVGPDLQKKLIHMLRPAAAEITGYPAFFNHCSPKAMCTLFKEAGFEDIKLNVYYRANDYFAFFLPAYILVTVYERLCKMLRLKTLSSGFIISARRP